jgi:dolichyl-phosphate-mannose--protein O-mannosyl transferase
VQYIHGKGIEEGKKNLSEMPTKEKNSLAKIQLQRKPIDPNIISIFSSLQVNLVKIFQASVEHSFHNSSTSWMRYENSCSKMFLTSIALG